MTLNEIAYNLLNAYRGGRSSNTDNVSLEQIKFNVKHYRAMFIRRDFNRNGITTRHFEQDLGCVPLEKVDASKCCGLPIDCDVWRTSIKIPRTVRYNFTDAITYIGDITGLRRYPLVSAFEIQWIPYDSYTAGLTKAYFIEDYLYIYNPKGSEYVNIRGVFEDPEEASNFSFCGEDANESCYSDDDIFPIAADMLQGINNGILNGELLLLASTPSDTEQDQQTLINQPNVNKK